MANNKLDGKRIKCIEMLDDHNPVPSGTEGTVRFKDDAGTIHVQWDNGQHLGLVDGLDQYEILEPKETDTSDVVSMNHIEIIGKLLSAYYAKADGEHVVVLAENIADACVKLEKLGIKKYLFEKTNSLEIVL